MRDNTGRFMKGCAPENKLPIGTIRIRTRHRRNGEQRAFIKIAEPDVWILRARDAWESKNGPIPPNLGIHHKDRDKLNDDIGNLELVSNQNHLEEHRSEFQKKSIANLVRARKTRRWSTKSPTKKTGHPATWSDVTMEKAISVYRETGKSLRSVAKDFGIPAPSLSRHIKNFT